MREHLIGACHADALALYLFLLTVADAQGLSYYSDQSILCRLSFFDPARLAGARAELQRLGWIAYEAPLYQVLALDVASSEQPKGSACAALKSPAPRRATQPVAGVEMLRRALEGRHDQL